MFIVEMRSSDVLTFDITQTKYQTYFDNMNWKKHVAEITITCKMGLYNTLKLPSKIDDCGIGTVYQAILNLENKKFENIFVGYKAWYRVGKKSKTLIVYNNTGEGIIL